MTDQITIYGTKEHFDKIDAMLSEEIKKYTEPAGTLCGLPVFMTKDGKRVWDEFMGPPVDFGEWFIFIPKGRLQDPNFKIPPIKWNYI